MSKKVLILHSEDNKSRAQIFQEQLNDAGFIASSVGELNRTDSTGVYNLIQQYIDDRDIIVILVSSGIFASCVIRFGIGYALGSAKTIVSVFKESDCVILPYWYEDIFKHTYTNREIVAKLKAI